MYTVNVLSIQALHTISALHNCAFFYSAEFQTLHILWAYRHFTMHGIRRALEQDVSEIGSRRHLECRILQRHMLSAQACICIPPLPLEPRYAKSLFSIILSCVTICKPCKYFFLLLLCFHRSYRPAASLSASSQVAKCITSRVSLVKH